jgi:hypothetical protein
MRAALRLHPDSHCTAVTRIDVEVARPDTGTLVLAYALTGDPTGLRIPPVSAPERADGLWEHTCFEAFIRASTRSGYCELNLAPSTRWAAYRFSDHRQGMCIAEEVGPPRIDVHATGTRFTLQASLTFDRPPGLPDDLLDDAPWQLGLAAVIEDTSGNRSYWALAHPPGRADLHHSDCFALEIPAALRA